MRTGIVCVTVLTGLAVLYAGQGGESSHEAVIKEMLTTLGQATKILEGVTDEPSAVAARPDLKKVGQHLGALRKQAAALKQPEKNEKDRLEREYRNKFEDALKKLRIESVRVKAIPGGIEALKEIAVEPQKKKDKGKGKGKKDKK
jgi:hypothetical protein